MKPKYRIDRITPGGFRDSLCQLWEGDDLPTFRVARPYLFDDEATAQRVMWRLQATCNETLATPHFPAKPITYQVVTVQCQYRSHIGMDFKNDHGDLFCFQLLGPDGTAHATVNLTNGLVTEVQAITSLSLRQSALIRLAMIHFRKSRTACRCDACKSELGMCYGYNTTKFPNLVARGGNHWIYANEAGDYLAAIAVDHECTSTHWGDIAHLRKAISQHWMGRELTEYGISLAGAAFVEASRNRPVNA